MATEIRKPTSHTDSSSWTNPSHSYDNTTVAGDSTTAATDDANADLDPSIVFDTWAASGSTAYNTLEIKVRYASSGFTDDEFGIHYSIDGGTGYTDLVALGFRNQSITTVSASLASSQSLADLAVKISTNKQTGGDNGTISIYDIWTEGEYLDPLVVSASAVTGPAEARDPTVVQGTIQYIPSPMLTYARTFDPTVIQGSIVLTAFPASTVTEMGDPKVVFPIRPGAMSTAAGAQDPIVIQSSLTIVPESIKTAATSFDPSVVLGTIVFIPDPASSAADTEGPKIVEILRPAPMSTRAEGADPSVVYGAIQPLPMSMAAEMAGPIVELGTITFSPVPMGTGTEFVIGTAVGGIPQRVTGGSRLIGIVRIKM